MGLTAGVEVTAVWEGQSAGEEEVSVGVIGERLVMIKDQETLGQTVLVVVLGLGYQQRGQVV